MFGHKVSDDILILFLIKGASAIDDNSPFFKQAKPVFQQLAL
jgi:hypothetical protein